VKVPSKPTIWSEYKENQCLELVKQGFSASQIADQLGPGFSRSSVAGWLWRHNKKNGAELHLTGVHPAHTKWTDEMLATLKRLAIAGSTRAQIAAELGITKSAVIGQLIRNKWKVLVRHNRQGPTVLAPARSVKLRPDEIEPKRIRLIDAGLFQCRWIPGEEKDEAGFALCCGHPTVPGKSWCPYHFTRVFVGAR
jgi:hypothetical protein